MTTIPAVGSEKMTPWGVALKPVPRKRFSEIVTSKHQESVELTTMESNNHGSKKPEKKISSKAEKIQVAVEVTNKVSTFFVLFYLEMSSTIFLKTGAVEPPKLKFNLQT